MSVSGMKRNWDLPFTLNFSLVDGMSGEAVPTRRHLSAMKGMYVEDEFLVETLNTGDPLVYEFYELNPPPDAGGLAFGTSITYPGKVGDEYYMTKGHFHMILETAEVYWCIRGEGLMLMENPDGDVRTEKMYPGAAVHVPQRYAHRTINTGTEPLATFFVFRADAGHDYGTIETRGFRKLVVSRGGMPVLIDNPKWREGTT